MNKLKIPLIWIVLSVVTWSGHVYGIDSCSSRVHGTASQYKMAIAAILKEKGPTGEWTNCFGECIQLSQQLETALIGKGLYPQRKLGNGHWFLIAEAENKIDVVIIDPTYKQFFEDLGEPYGKNEPDIFVGTRQDWYAMALRFDRNGSPALKMNVGLGNNSTKQSPEEYFRSIYGI